MKRLALQIERWPASVFDVIIAMAHQRLDHAQEG